MKTRFAQKNGKLVKFADTTKEKQLAEVLRTGELDKRKIFSLIGSIASSLDDALVLLKKYTKISPEEFTSFVRKQSRKHEEKEDVGEREEIWMHYMPGYGGWELDNLNDQSSGDFFYDYETEEEYPFNEYFFDNYLFGDKEKTPDSDVFDFWKNEVNEGTPLINFLDDDVFDSLESLGDRFVSGDLEEFFKEFKQTVEQRNLDLYFDRREVITEAEKVIDKALKDSPVDKRVKREIAKSFLYEL